MQAIVEPNDNLLPVLEKAIEQTGNLADFLGDSSYAADHTKLVELKKRLVSGRFHLAVLGQFKRGKSTLLNSLLGERILPVSIVPLTAIPTWIQKGEIARANVEFLNSNRPAETFADGTASVCDFLSRFVTEAANPNNRLGVSRVELYHPAPILRDGLVFIDTPGIGSTFRHNTDTTLRFLPECDAALFLVSADPPITETEVEFLKQVKARVPRLFFVVNKVDYLTHAEVDEAVGFFRKVLEEKVGISEDATIFPVSARDALRAKVGGDSELWRTSGMEEVESHLVNFLLREKGAALRAAVRFKAVDIVEDVMMRLRLAQRSLELPIEDLQQRLDVFGHKIEELHQQRQDARDLLSGDKLRARISLEQQYEALCDRAKRQLSDTLDKELAIAAGRIEEEQLQAALNVAVPSVFELKFKEFIRVFDRQLMDVLRPHEERLDRLVESIRKTAVDLFDVPYKPFDNSVTPVETREPYWVTHHYEDSFGPITPGMIDRITPPGIRRRRIERRFRLKIDSLVMSNAGRLRERLYDQIESTFSKFGRDLDERVAATIAATHGAALAAIRKRQTSAGSVASEVDRVRRSIDALAEIAPLLGPASRVDTEQPDRYHQR
jgi:hypothetical protein